MIKLFKLAWRNVWRNRRRSLITMAAVLFSVVIIGAAKSVQVGVWELTEELAVRLFTGDVQVQRTGYQEEQTLSYALLEEEKDWTQVLAAEPWVEGHARRLTGFGLVSSDASSAGAMIVGIEPAAEPQVSTFTHNPTAGHPLAVGDDHLVLIGEALARNLDVSLGDTVVVLTQGYRNEMGADLYAVKGLIRTGSPEMDRATMVMPLPDAQVLFSMPGRFTQVVLRTDDLRKADGHAATLRRTLADERYDVLSWETLMNELRQRRTLDQAGDNIFYFFLLLLAGFEIFNTTMMSAMERMREFGVMQAIGMKPRQTALLVFLELIIKITLALAAGLLVTYALGMAMKGHPIPLGEETLELFRSFGVLIEGIEFSTQPIVFILPLVSVALVSLLATCYPVLRVWRLSTIGALRQ